jgi:hypothetical protein
MEPPLRNDAEHLARQASGSKPRWRIDTPRRPMTNPAENQELTGQIADSGPTVETTF